VVDSVSVRPVLGLDIGGTWTRALAVDTSGARLGHGRAAGANPIAHGVVAAAERIAAALGQALAGADPASVAACVVGMAGTSKLAADPAAAAAFAALWPRFGLRCEVEIVGDVTAAFAAGSAEPDGSVLLAGTGAIAASIGGRRPAGLRGGHGWLLGDEGSGFWIGRQAVRAALAALEDQAPRTELTEAVLDRYARQAASGPPGPGGGSDPYRLPGERLLISALISAVHTRAPVELAGLVPLVTAAAEHGDPAAERIVREAAEHLAAILHRVRTPHDSSSVVLAGGVLSPQSPVHRLVLSAVSDTWPGAPATTGSDGAAGAAWLAALRLLGDGPAACELHSVLIQQSGSGSGSGSGSDSGPSC
jgi:glucosamine kinase